MTENSDTATLLDAASQAAAAYEWEEARDLFTKALDASEIPPEIEYKLRMGRAESYRYMANLYGERADLEIAIHLARQVNHPRQEIEALVKHCAVLTLTEGPTDGFRVAEEALALAEKIGAPKLVSDSLNGLTTALYVLDDIDEMVRFYERWVLLVEELDNPVLNCLRCGLEMVEMAREVPAKWQVRVGINFGSVMGGIVGQRQYLFDIWGDTVNTAQRIESHGAAGRVNLSQTAWERVQDHCIAQNVGTVEVKGKGPMEIYQVIKMC